MRIKPFLLIAFTVLFLGTGGHGVFAQSQAVDSLPGWLVPVVRLVSATHVEPTTGIVIARERVLIPAEFASVGEEIIVLDGGTDIVRDGRPAKIEQRLAGSGLQIVRVPGLNRPVANITGQPLADDANVVLNAFPTAEQIAEGQPPLVLPARVSALSESGMARIHPETQLPDVSGALLDSCGNLVGVSIADDIQEMASSSRTVYRWLPTLLRIQDELGLAISIVDCRQAPAEQQPEESPTQAEPEPEPEPEPEKGPTTPEPDPVPEPDPAPTGAPTGPESAPTGEDTTLPEPEMEDEDELDLDRLPPYEAPDKEAESGAWPWLLAAAVLLVTGVGIHYWRRRSEHSEPETGKELPVIEIESEQEAEITIDQHNAVLVLKGRRSNGEALELSCPVNDRAINCVIGRGEVELKINSPAISRRHARVSSHAEHLTLTDLGSSNGSAVNDIPCMAGECFYIGPGDQIVLGDAHFTISVEPAVDSE